MTLNGKLIKGISIAIISTAAAGIALDIYRGNIRSPKDSGKQTLSQEEEIAVGKSYIMGVISNLENRASSYHLTSAESDKYVNAINIYHLSMHDEGELLNEQKNDFRKKYGPLLNPINPLHINPSLDENSLLEGIRNKLTEKMEEYKASGDKDSLKLARGFDDAATKVQLKYINNDASKVWRAVR